MIKILGKFKLPLLIVLVFIILWILVPDLGRQSTNVVWDYFKEMAIIMPPVFILMGLMEVWVPKDKIHKWFGTGSGIRGTAISIALGTLPTGPLYIAFPMAASLIRKGASVSNMIIFLGSWAALKIPQLMVEIKFLGISFAAWRFVLTLLALFAMGTIMELVLKLDRNKGWLPPAEADNIIAQQKNM
ncbi:MAG TPA: permease [Gudongella oleilytica]|nr:permease [Gudongella oleilytica]